MKSIFVRCSAVCFLIFAGAAKVAATEAATLSEIERSKVIREAYLSLEDYARVAGTDLTFELTDFKTYRRDELDTVYWIWAITMPGGAMIDVHRETHMKAWNGEDGEDSEDGETRVAFLPTWNDEGEDYFATADGLRLTNLTIDQALGEIVEDQPEFERVQTVTSFQVLVSLSGRQRVYRAAAFWTPGDSRDIQAGTTAGLILLDNITQAVDEAAVEILEPMTEAWKASDPAGLARGGEFAWSDPVQCEPSGSLELSPFSQRSTTGHVIGDHRIDGIFEIECRCSVTCKSTCEGSMFAASCSESGLVSTACHRRGTASHGSSTFSYGGPASCAVGYICGISACNFCSCGITITVTVSGTKVTFGGGGTLDNLQRSFSGTCPECVPCVPGGEH